MTMQGHFLQDAVLSPWRQTACSQKVYLQSNMKIPHSRGHFTGHASTAFSKRFFKCFQIPCIFFLLYHPFQHPSFSCFFFFLMPPQSTFINIKAHSHTAEFFPLNPLLQSPNLLVLSTSSDFTMSKACLCAWNHLQNLGNTDDLTQGPTSFTPRWIPLRQGIWFWYSHRLHCVWVKFWWLSPPYVFPHSQTKPEVHTTLCL